MMDRIWNWCDSKQKLWRILFILLSVLASVKIAFMGTEIDEQYAVTMAYRMVKGDRMFLEMWELHQTSGFLTAILIKFFLTVTGGVDHLFVFLRLSGAFLQALISLFLYDTLKKYCSSGVAFAASVFFFNTLPKCSQIPDFSNMQVWFSTLAFLCLMRYFAEENGRLRWMVLCGVNLSLLVLSYPTCVLMLIPVFAGLWDLKKSNRQFLIWTGSITGTCALCCAVYLGYFLSHIPLTRFLQGIGQIVQDPSHSLTLAEKIAGWRGDIVRAMPYTLAVLAISAVIWGAIRVLKTAGEASFLSVMFCVSCAEQVYLWLFKNYYFRFTYLFWFVLFLIGIFRFFMREKYGIKRDNPIFKALFWFGSMGALALLLAAYAASNTALHESFPYLMIGMLSSVVYWDYEKTHKRGSYYILTLTLLGIVLMMKGFMVYGSYGYKDNIFVVRQKALSGPLKGIYCIYFDGCDYNDKAELIEANVPRGSKVFYVGADTIIYIMGEFEVCNYSSISTPAFDERLFEYWRLYPDKAPEYIIIDSWIPTGTDFPGEIRDRLLSPCEAVVENEKLDIYRVDGVIF